MAAIRFDALLYICNIVVASFERALAQALYQRVMKRNGARVSYIQDSGSIAEDSSSSVKTRSSINDAVSMRGALLPSGRTFHFSGSAYHHGRS
jgi:hypothetical protein